MRLPATRYNVGHESMHIYIYDGVPIPISSRQYKHVFPLQTEKEQRPESLHMPRGSLDGLVVSDADFERYNGHCQVRKFDLPRSADDPTTILVDPKATAQDLVHWLGQPGSQSRPAQGTMKLLLFQTRNQSTARSNPTKVSAPHAVFLGVPPRRQTLQSETDTAFVLDVLNSLDLPVAAFGSYIKAHITFISVPALSSNSPGSPNTAGASPCIKYYCSGTSWAVTWTYCPLSRHTAAVMWHREGDGDERKAEVIADLLRLQNHLTHPMLLGFIKTKISLSFTFDMLDGMNRDTLALEQSIGFPTWNWVLDRVEPGRGVGDAQDQAVEGFNVLSGKLTNIRFRLRTFQQQIKFISRCNAAHRLSLVSSSTPPTNLDLSLRECDELQIYTDVMWDYLFIHLFDADSLGERLQNAMGSVFQLTTQRDSRASLAIADINNELARQAGVKH